ncbi:Uncharacterised protein [Mycobacteroides abscessus subsp. abscessus]|nr:Uncharacterised protein [Mycobacteroides abscessus subsp. abscessus]
MGATSHPILLPFDKAICRLDLVSQKPLPIYRAAEIGHSPPRRAISERQNMTTPTDKFDTTRCLESLTRALHVLNATTRAGLPSEHVIAAGKELAEQVEELVLEIERRSRDGLGPLLLGKRLVTISWRETHAYSGTFEVDPEFDIHDDSAVLELITDSDQDHFDGVEERQIIETKEGL